MDDEQSDGPDEEITPVKFPDESTVADSGILGRRFKMGVESIEDYVYSISRSTLSPDATGDVFARVYEWLLFGRVYDPTFLADPKDFAREVPEETKRAMEAARKQKARRKQVNIARIPAKQLARVGASPKTPLQILVEKEKAQIIPKLLMTIERDYARVLYYFYLRKWPWEEIASLVGRSVSRVKHMRNEACVMARDAVGGDREYILEAFFS